MLAVRSRRIVDRRHGVRSDADRRHDLWSIRAGHGPARRQSRLYYFVADLDCSASPGEAVKLQGKLLLNGFTLTGHAASDVVSCELGACRVVGPGTVTGGTDGVRSKRGARIEAGAVITANGGDGVRTDKTAKVFDATVSANGGDGVRSKTTATISGSTITGNTGDGVRTDGSVTIKASTVGGNGGNGVDSDKNAKALKLSTINGNGFDGIRGIRSTLVDSTATGNRTNAACGVSDECADVALVPLPSGQGIEHVRDEPEHRRRRYVGRLQPRLNEGCGSY